MKNGQFNPEAGKETIVCMDCDDIILGGGGMVVFDQCDKCAALDLEVLAEFAEEDRP